MLPSPPVHCTQAYSMLGELMVQVEGVVRRKRVSVRFKGVLKKYQDYSGLGFFFVSICLVIPIDKTMVPFVSLFVLLFYFIWSQKLVKRGWISLWNLHCNLPRLTLMSCNPLIPFVPPLNCTVLVSHHCIKAVSEAYMYTLITWHTQQPIWSSVGYIAIYITTLL